MTEDGKVSHDMFYSFLHVTYLSQFNFYFIKLFNSLYWTRYILLMWANDLWSFWKVWIFEKRDIIHSIRGQTNKGLKVRSSFWHMSDHWKFSVVTFFNVQPIYFYRMLHYFPWFFLLDFKYSHMFNYLWLVIIVWTF